MDRYYHVDRGARLERGMVLELIGLDGLPREVAARAERWFPNGVTLQGQRFLQAAATAPNAEIEVMFELMRRAEFNARPPSRFASVFAFATVDEARSFRARYPGPLPDGASAPIWGVDGDAVLRANMGLLDQHSTVLMAMVNASAYWAGEVGYAPELWELLLRPPVTIAERVD
jgi:hypothetical protein